MVPVVGSSLLLTSSEGSLWDYARNSPDTQSDGDSTQPVSQSGTSHHDSGEVENGSEPAGGSSGDETEIDEAEKCVLIYVRVSSNEQKEDGRSLESQEDELTSIVDANPNMRTYMQEPIRDEGKTGTNFEREGIQRVAELAHNDEVTHLFVDTIDRIGRSVAETIMFIKHLRTKCDVKLLTRTQEFDVLKPTDKMQVTMLASMADFGTMNRARSSHRSKADNFLKDKQWSSWYGSDVPVGYVRIDEEDWIQPIEWMKPIIRDIFDEFIEQESYADVESIINERYSEELSRLSEETNEDGDINEDSGLTYSQIRSMLRRPLYKGEPTIPVTSLEHYEPYPSIVDPGLALVSEDKFKKAQEIIVELRKKHSSNENVTFSPADYNEEFSPFVVEATSPIVELQCPKCRERLNSRGQYLIDGEHASRMYECSNAECDFYRRWPNESEREMMKMLVNLDKLHSIL
ncbi:recombinase family protein [Natronorubrum sediminis]|uniref:recombinase family protein n=1 Tax=Natronorubrum sediminis TaxID=640943 RepID=UPI001587C094|nr:recombinase family protein [Natronorubrum sediminis]